MKHPIWKTFEIFFWVVISLLFSIVLVPRISVEKTTIMRFQEPIYTVLIVLIMVATVLFGALIWYLIIKFSKSPKYVDVMFGIGMASIFQSPLLILSFGSDSAAPTIFSVCLYLVLCLFFITLIKAMQASWSTVRLLYWIPNLVWCIGLPTVAIKIGLLLPPWASLLLLGALAVYDAVAVYKTKHMVLFAKFFMKRKILPGIVVPYEKKNHLALLGGGDIFFLIMVAASFYRVDHLTAYFVGVGMFLSIIWIFIFSEKKKFYPALPFIFIGSLLGVLVRFFI